MIAPPEPHAIRHESPAPRRESLDQRVTASLDVQLRGVCRVQDGGGAVARRGGERGEGEQAVELREAIDPGAERDDILGDGRLQLE